MHEQTDKASPMGRGVSICILTYNVFFYNRLAVSKIRELTRVVDYEILVYDNASTDGSAEWLAAQPDVRLFRGEGNTMRHGEALNFLVRRARYPICCTLCSDAFPVSPEWLVPAMYLDDSVYLSGIFRSGGKKRLADYVCPSYLFGWTEWLKRHNFRDNWPKWDTGEKMGKDCIDEGHAMQTWKASSIHLDGFKPKRCDYNGWVWHTWWSGRAQTVPGIAGRECEKDYHDRMQNLLRERFQLDY